jgi:1-acyl-sn-glycerol-3-phosphate acyltransferase
VQPGSDALEERVAAIAASLGAPVDDPDAPLDLSPLGRTEFALALEEALGVRLEDSSGLRTVTDAVAAVAPQERERRPTPTLHPATGKLQGIARAIAAPALRWYFNLVVRGAERIPRSGAVVIAPNHRSMWDIPLLAVASPRPIVFMAEEGVFGSAIASWFFTRLGGFPVRRGAGDLRAIRAASTVVRSHRVLGIYPEGTRGRGVLLPFRPGAAWIALRAGAPLVPAGIRGTEGIVSGRISIPRRVRVEIEFGEPIDVEHEPDPNKRMDQASDLTDRIRSEVERLIRRS